jgi:hypothetical protein
MKHTLFRLICLIGWLWPVALWAQTPADTLIPSMASRPPSARWVLKFAPLSLFDVNNTLQFGLEHLQKRGRGAWQVEAGYGQGQFAFLTFQQRESERQRTMETWRARAEYRLYTKRQQRWAAPEYRRPHGTYLAFDVFFKQVNHRETGTVGRDCDDGPCNYYQNYQTPVLSYTAGGRRLLPAPARATTGFSICMSGWASAAPEPTDPVCPPTPSGRFTIMAFTTILAFR